MHGNSKDKSTSRNLSKEIIGSVNNLWTDIYLDLLIMIKRNVSKLVNI